jgi:hypothetical protein
MSTIPGYDPRFEPRIADAIPLDLVQQIWDEGLRVRWEKAQRCACNLKVTNAADSTYGFLAKEGAPECPDCRGTGYLYYGAQEIRALVSATSDNPKWLELYGELADGSVQITLLPEHVPNKRDRFTVLDQIRRFDEQIVHRENPERLTYPIIVTPTTTGTEGDPYTPQTMDLGILNARYASADGLIVSTPLVVGTDIDVTADGEVEYLSAGTYASGLGLLFFAGSHAGTEIPAGTRFVVDNTGLAYVTTADAWMAVFSGGFSGAVVPVKAEEAGSAYNLSAGEYDVTLADYALTSGTFSPFPISNGTDSTSPVGVGQVVSFDYYCRPSYIVRVLPHYAREAYVDAMPYVNATSGDQGYWTPLDGEFPSDAGIARGDYYLVTSDGTLDGQAFVEGQYLVALVNEPSSTTYAGQWLAITPGVAVARLAKLPTMVLCWLEDLGDPSQPPPQAP